MRTIEIPKTVRDAADLAAEAKRAADEARQVAERAAAGANPQLSTFAAIALPTMAATMTNKQVLSVSTLWPAWSAEGVGYKVGDVVQHEEQVYRCVQDHASQASWTPDAAPSLWDAVTIDPETGYDVWRKPSGEQDAYNIGDRVLYPDAGGQVYESLIDGNVWSPEEFSPGWRLVEE